MGASDFSQEKCMLSIYFFSSLSLDDQWNTLGLHLPPDTSCLGYLQVYRVKPLMCKATDLVASYSPASIEFLMLTSS